MFNHVSQKSPSFLNKQSSGRKGEKKRTGSPSTATCHATAGFLGSIWCGSLSHHLICADAKLDFFFFCNPNPSEASGNEAKNGVVHLAIVIKKYNLLTLSKNYCLYGQKIPESLNSSCPRL